MNREMTSKWPCIVALCVCGLLVSPASAETLLSTFEQDLSTTVGVDWTVGGSASTAFTTDGATHLDYAIKITHTTGWNTNLTLDTPLTAPLIAANDFMLFDTTTPATTDWRQMFVIMQGEGQGWTQRPLGLPAGATGTVTLDLNEMGVRPAAAAGPSWWQIFLVHQGGDVGGTSPIMTTIDNIRFAVPEPASAAFALFGLGTALCLVRRRES